ncbi:MAG TPA: hypothetical protein VL049_17080 [Candidatus Dormibacteraeota bacterium]|nr:hypothetical protein [Candidatus Dormibacteraeota bacterium]
MYKRFAWIGAGAVLAVASVAAANVIDPTVGDAQKADYKLRADVAKQVAKYTFCLVKAATKCEKKGTSSVPECHLNTGAVDFEAMPGDLTAKFQDGIAKCDAKLVLTKKGTDYVGIGCPGDCNAAAPGVQQCADMNAFEATVEGTATLADAKVNLGILAAAIDASCATDLGGLPTDQARIDCAFNNAKALSKYGQGLFKCQQKCELDLKDKKGDGGLTNDPNCLVGVMGSDPAFNTCAASALTKAGTLSPTVASGVVPLVQVAINTATDGLFNRFDPTSTPDASPCGTCGNATREGAEECDGADAALCPGLCHTDCTCP